MKYEPELNLCQKEVLLYSIDRDDFFFSTSLLHLKSRHAVTEFFDHVFGLLHLRKNHIHGGIAVSDDMYSYMKKKFQGDNTISDMLVLKAWDLNSVLQSGNLPPSSILTDVVV